MVLISSNIFGTKFHLVEDLGLQVDARSDLGQGKRLPDAAQIRSASVMYQNRLSVPR